MTIKSSVVPKWWIWVVILIAMTMLLIAGAWGWSKLTKNLSGLPCVQMVVEGKNWPIDGHPVGANYMGGYYDDLKNLLYYIPSLQGVWQLDEAYAQSSVQVRSNTNFLTLTCYHKTVGGFQTLPHSIYAVRFDQSVVSMHPGESLEWSEGEMVILELHGTSYQIKNPQVNSVYVVRTTWDNGVLEHAWIITEEN